MGNLLGANKVIEPEESLGVGLMSVPLLLNALEPSKLTEAPKKVRFQLQDRPPPVTENNKAGGVVKFKIAVSREELNRIVTSSSNGLRYSSVEELLQGMEVTSRKISDVTTDAGKAGQKWTSQLDSLAKKQD